MQYIEALDREIDGLSDLREFLLKSRPHPCCDPDCPANKHTESDTNCTELDYCIVCYPLVESVEKLEERIKRLQDIITKEIEKEIKSETTIPDNGIAINGTTGTCG